MKTRAARTRGGNPHWENAGSVLSYIRSNRISTYNPHYGNLAPGEADLRLLGDVHSKNILEIGCGRGQNSIAFTRWGARCTAVDISTEMISHGELLAQQEGVAVDYRAMDARDLSGLPEKSFDIVFSSYALSLTGDLRATFRSAQHCIAAGGQFVFCFTHPAQMPSLTGHLLVSEREPGEEWYENVFPINQVVNWLLSERFLVERIVEQITTNPSQLSAAERAKYPYEPLTKLRPKYDVFTHLPHTIIYSCRSL